MYAGGDMRRTFTMCSRHVFSMCWSEPSGRHFECLPDVLAEQIWWVLVDRIVNVFVGFIMNTF
jgi:hypothetical protein